MGYKVSQLSVKYCLIEKSTFPLVIDSALLLECRFVIACSV